MGEELFSRRYGYVSAKTLIQTESIDADLRVALWNALYRFYFAGLTAGYWGNDDMHDLAVVIWGRFFRRPIDDLPERQKELQAHVKDRFFTWQWHYVYDLLDFFCRNTRSSPAKTSFISDCNTALEQELSGYRIVGGRVAPLTSRAEVGAIDEALEASQRVGPVQIHLETALTLLADRQSPDYRNSIKESISAVEALCVTIAGQPKATLGTALAVIEKRIGLHGALKGSLNQLYGYTSDASGIRHALFMLVSCAGFVSYLLAKAAKAGIAL